MIKKAYKVRLYPNKEQEVLLQKTFGCVRKVWNTLLANNKEGFATNGSEWKQQYNTTVLKDDFEFLKEVSAAALQQKSRDLKETYSQWFKSLSGKRKASIGEPRFKKRGVRESYRLPVKKFTVFQDEQLLRLEKIGKVSCKYSAIIPEDVKWISVTISKSYSGKFYASVLVEQEVKPLPLTGKRVGIDLGIKELMTLSSGHTIKNPRFLRESQSKIARIQKHLSRKIKGSNRYLKCKQRLAREHEKVANKREWFQHNITKALVREFDVIAVETLEINSMKTKFSRVNSSLYDTSLYEILRQLDYKSNWYGKSLVKVDKWFASSQLCSSCGKQHKELKDLKIREWVCDCGAKHQRDYNASLNILKQGFKNISGELLDYRREEFLQEFCVAEGMKKFVETSTFL